MMQKWGYNLVDKIIWVKMKDKNVYLSHGYYFMHSFEMCLIGYKNIHESGLSEKISTQFESDSPNNANYP